MKFLMLLSLIPFLCFSKEKILDKKTVIENSTVYIRVLKPEIDKKDSFTIDTSASGMLASYKNKNYLLTNSHVCLGYWKSKIWESKDAWTLEDDLKTSEVHYKIETRFNEYQSSKYMSEIKLDLDRDICAIPVNLPKDLLGKIYKLDDNKPNLNDSHVSYFTFNRSKGFTLTELKGEIIEKGNDQRRLEYLSSEKTTKIYQRSGDYYRISQDAIHGDSGSPLFDSSYNLKGLVFGSSTVNKKRNFGIALLYKDIVDLLDNPSNIVSNKLIPTSLPPGVK